MAVKEKKDRYAYLTGTPVPSLIVKLSIPTIICMLVTGIYNACDTYFVGQIEGVGTQATAAVGIVFPLMAVIQAIGFFFGHGSGNFLSRMLGAGEKDKANEMAATGFALALLFGIFFAIVGNIFIEPIARFLASDDVSADTLRMTVSYGGIILIGAPFMMGQFVINNQLRFQGAAMVAMAGLMSGAVVNMGLDPLLILHYGMGVKGAAIATISGQIISFCILLLGAGRGENIRMKVKNVRINFYYIGQIVNGGAPSLFRQGLAAVSTTMLNRAAGSFGGDAAIAGMSIVTRVMMLVSSALIGFGQGYQPVCSFNFGAGLKKRVREGFAFCVKWGTLFLTAAACACFVFAPQIIRAFRDDDAVVAVGTVALRCQSVALPLLALSVITNMMLQSIGSGLKASITSSARNGIFFIPAILILPKLFGLTGVEVTQTVADVCAVALAVPMGLSELKKM